MTTINETELAQWGRGFIGERDWDAVISICENEDRTDEWNLFESRYTAPILAHLAERKLEEMGLEWKIGGIVGGVFHANVQYLGKVSMAGAKDKNKYKALWQAIKKAVEG